MKQLTFKRGILFFLAMLMVFSVMVTPLINMPISYAAPADDYITVNAANGNDGVKTNGGFLNAGADGFIEGNINGDEWYLSSGNSISFTFCGTALKVIGGTNYDMGIINIYLDGEQVGTKDCYTADWLKGQELYVNGELADDIHTVTIEASGNKNAASSGNINVVDAFMYVPSEFTIVNASDAEKGFQANGFLNKGSDGYIQGDIEGDEWFLGTPGEKITYTFEGTRIMVIGGKNADMGHAAISIDGGEATIVDCYNAEWILGQKLYDSGELTDEEHTITIECLSERNEAATANVITVDAFMVLFSPYEVANATDTNPAIATKGGFLNKGANGYIEGNIEGDEWYMGSANESISFTFSGTEIYVIGGKNADMGLADVYIDDVYIETIDCYNASWIKGQTLFEKKGLEDRVHKVTVVCKGEHSDASTGNVIVVDAFRYAASMNIPDSAYVVANATTSTDGISVDGGFLNKGANGYIPGNIEGDEWYLSGTNSISYTFNGSRIQVIGGKNNDMGYAEIYLDGKKVHTEDCYNSSWIKGQVLYDSGFIAEGEHTIKVLCNGEKNSASSNNMIVVDAFKYIPVIIEPNEIIRVENNSKHINYKNGTVADDAAASEGSVTEFTGEATFSFEGRMVELVGKKDAAYGVADVYIDEMYAGQIDQSGASEGYEVLFTSQPLSAAAHTLKIVPAGKNAIDFIEYMAVSSLDGSYIVDAGNKELVTLAGTTSVNEDSKGFLGDTITLSNGASAEMQFFGSSVGVYVNSYAGNGDLKVYVDDSYVTTIDVPAEAADFNLVYNIPDLLNTSHKIKVESVGEVKLDALTYSRDARVRVNDDNPEMSFTSGFWTGVFAGDDGQTTFISGGGYMSMSFTGTSCYVYGPRNTNLGIGKVYIDGELVGQFDEYSASWDHQKLLFAIEGLEPCEHTVKVENTNSKCAESQGTYVLVDYVEYDAYEIPSKLNVTGITFEDADSVILTTDSIGARLIDNYDFSIKRGSGALSLIPDKNFTVNKLSDTAIELTLDRALSTGDYIKVAGSRNFTGEFSTQYISETAVRLNSAELDGTNKIIVKLEENEATFTQYNFNVEVSKNYGSKVKLAADKYTIVKNSATEYVLNLTDALESGDTVLITGNGDLYGVLSVQYVGDENLVINDTDDKVSYNGNWEVKTFSDCYNSDFSKSVTKGDSFEVSFTGTKAYIEFVGLDTNGTADICVDGVMVEEDFDLSSEYTFETEELAEGTHTITVMNSSLGENKTVALDYIRFTPCKVDSDTYFSLNGVWEIVKDETGAKGNSRKWYEQANYPSASAKDVYVPGNVYEAFPNYNGITWYGKTFDGNIAKAYGDRLYLEFEAVQYSCDVYLNGVHLGSHEGAAVPFEFDVTDVINLYGENFLAVRVFNPLGMCKTGSASNYGAFWDAGGIWQEVGIHVRPEVYIDYIYADSDWQTGEVDLEVTVVNSTIADKTVNVFAEYGVRGYAAGGSVHSGDVVAQPGVNTYTLSYKISDHKLWTLDEPNLYFAEATVKVDGKTHTVKDDHLGFRHFEIKDGYFYLNGERIFVKMTHQNAYDPVTLQASSRDMKYVNKATQQLKDAGFNVFRAIGMECMPEQLDYADEIGILVYSESSQGWLGANNWIESVQDETIIRDRNHPSLVIWGLLNEIYASDSRVEQCRAYLPRLRELDNDRVVFLDSGRFDHDYTVAGVSNSGSKTWDVFFGEEGTADPSVGDIHTYPQYPMNEAILDYILNAGGDANPVIVSEAGTGAMFNPFVELRGLEAEGAANEGNYPYIAWDKALATGLTDVYEKYGLSSLYDSAEGIPLDSINVNLTQRLIMINYIRANDKVNGYGVTSLSDSQGLGEGLLDNFRDWKPGYKELMENAWASLRWSILLNNSNLNVNRGDEIRLRANITTEDVLAPGEYTASFYIENDAGNVVYTLNDESFVVSDAANAPFAYDVLDQTIAADFPAGTYTLYCQLNADYKVANVSMDFVVTDNSGVLEGEQDVTVLGTLTDSMREVLEKNGVNLVEYSATEKIDNEVIFVGKNVPDDAELWRGLYKKIAAGAYAVFLDSAALGTDNNWFPSYNKGGREVVPLTMALYHADHLALPDETLFAGLETGMMDPAFYGEQLLVPRNYFVGLDEPDEMNILMLYSQGLPIKGETISGTAMGTYNFHNGAFTINILDLCNETTSPAVGRLLLNLVEYGKEHSAAYTAIDESAINAELDSFNFKEDKVNMPTATLIDSEAKTVRVEFDEPVTFDHDCVYLSESPNPERYQSTGPASMQPVNGTVIDGKTYASTYIFTFPTVNNLFTNSPLDENGIPAGAGLRFLEYGADPNGANGKTPNVKAADGRQMKMNYVDGANDVGFVTITVPPVSISIHAAGGADLAAVGEELTLKADFAPAGTTQTKVNWSVVNGTGEATINEFGKLVGVKAGTVTVKAVSAVNSEVVAEKEFIVGTKLSDIIWEEIDDVDLDHVTYVGAAGAVHNDHTGCTGSPTNIDMGNNDLLQYFGAGHLINQTGHAIAGGITAKLTFTGVAFKFRTQYRGPVDGGYGDSLDVYVDGAYHTTISGLSGNNDTSLYEVVVNGLTDAQHVVELKSADGRRVMIDGFALGTKKPDEVKYKVNIAVRQGGTADQASQELVEGEDLIINITPDEGYELDYVLINGVKNTVAGNSVTINNIDKDLNYEFVFKKISIKVMVADIANATVKVQPENPVYGDDVVITITPDDNYIVEDLIVNGVSHSLTTTYKVENAKENITVDALVVSLAPVIPAPENVKATVVDKTTIKLTWSKVDEAAGYRVYRSEELNGEYSLIYTTYNADKLDVTNYNRVTGKPYYFKVCAITEFDGEYINGDESEVIEARALVAAPATVKAVSQNYNTLKISWTKVAGAEGYKVYRADSANGEYTAIYTTTNPDKLSVNNLNRVTGKPYYYKVCAITTYNGEQVDGLLSAYKQGKAVPSRPKNVASSSVSATTIKVSWDAVAGAKGYKLYASTSGKDGTFYLSYSTTNPNKTSVNVLNKTPGKTYYFKVRAISEYNGATVSGTLSAVVTGKAVPSKPVVTTAKASATSIRNSWKAVYKADGYEVYRSLTGKSGSFYLQKRTTYTSYTNTVLTKGQTYYYKVRAYTIENGKRVYGTFSTVKSVKL